MRVLPQAVDIVFEDKPLFRVVVGGETIYDIELPVEGLIRLAERALTVYYEAKKGKLPE